MQPRGRKYATIELIEHIPQFAILTCNLKGNKKRKSIIRVTVYIGMKVNV